MRASSIGNSFHNSANVSALISRAAASWRRLAIPVAGLLSVSLRHWREFREIERLVKTAGAREYGSSLETPDPQPADLSQRHVER